MDDKSRRPASKADLTFLETLFKRNYSRSEEGYAYPRCESANELLAELSLYNLTLSRAIQVLESNGRLVGAFGFLWDASKEGSGTMIERTNLATAYVIGPLVAPRLHAQLHLASMVERMEFDASRRFSSIKLCLVEQNRAMKVLLEERGWRARTHNLEMRWRPRKRLLGGKYPQVHIVRRIELTSDARVPAAAGMLASGFSWHDAPDRRLAEYLEEGYRLGCVELDGETVGVVIWIAVEGTEFGRLEYVVVRPDRRGNGIATTLVAYALNDLHDAGVKEVYLSVDPANTGAQALYCAQGFIGTIRSVVYEKRFTNTP